MNIFQCDSGYFGIDCSIPSAHSLAYGWPSWLHPPVNSPDLRIVNSTSINVKAIVQKKRPLIYVYDLPAEFDNHLLEVSLCRKFLFFFVRMFFKLCCSIEIIMLFFTGTTFQVAVCEQNLRWQKQNIVDQPIVWCPGLSF